MDLAQEVLIVGGKRCCIYDPTKMNFLIEYNVGFQDRKKPFTPKTLALINDHFMVGAVGKHIKVWKINSHETKNQIISLASGNISALTVTSCGAYCVAAVQNCLYIWQVLSGKLLSKVSINEQEISCLKFTSDNSLLVVGYKSGHVVTCFLSQLIAVQADKKKVHTHFKWNHHAAEVTDIFAGCLGTSSRLATASLDMTCKVYELDTGVLLTTICLDVPLLAVIMDPLEYYVFLGDDCGSIYKINLFERFPRELHFNAENMTKVKGHESGILSMSFSMEGNVFMSASEDVCKIWSMENLAVLSQVKVPADLMTNAFLAKKPAGLSERKVEAPFSIPMFDRNYESKQQNSDGSEPRQLRETILSSANTTQKDALDDLAVEEQYGNREFAHMKIAGEAVHPTISENLFLESLHGDSISELRIVNNQLYSFMVQKAMDKLPQTMQN